MELNNKQQQTVLPPLDLSNLTDAELAIVSKVLERDVILRHREQLRISQLSADLLTLRKRGVIRSGQNVSRTCARCRKRLGPAIIGLGGRMCSECKHSVCRGCLAPAVNGRTNDLLCVYCSKKRELDAMTGNWLKSALSRDRKCDGPTSGTELVLDAITHFADRRRHKSETGSAVSQSLIGEVRRVLNTGDGQESTTGNGGGLGSRDDAADRKLVLEQLLRSSPVRHVEVRRAASRCRSVDSGSDVDIDTGDVDSPLAPSSGRASPARSSSGRTVASLSNAEATDDDVTKSAAEPEVHSERPKRLVGGDRFFVRSDEKATYDISGNAVFKKSVGASYSLDTDALGREEHDNSVSPVQMGHRTVYKAHTIPVISITADTPSISGPSQLTDRTGPGSGAESGLSDEEDVGKAFKKYAKPGSGRSSPNTNLLHLSPYSDSKESLSSISSSYSDAGGEESFGKFRASGEIEFGVAYIDKLSCLEVAIKRCQGLTAVDAKKNASNPYVKCYLLPDKTRTGKRKTKVRKRTLDPVFDEIISYRLPKSALTSRVLCVMVWNRERFGRNDFLGEVNIALGEKLNIPVTWYKLQDRSVTSPDQSVTSESKGDVIVALKFEPSPAAGDSRDVTQVTTTSKRIQHKKSNNSVNNSGGSSSGGGGGSGVPSCDRGKLSVLVKEAHRLVALRSDGFSDPFCKCRLLPEGSPDSSDGLKTDVVRDSVNPVWNHVFTFNDVSATELSNCGLELTIWDHDPDYGNDFLGGVRLNLGASSGGDRHSVAWMDATVEEANLWKTCLERQDTWTEAKLALRSHMLNRRQ